MEASGKGRATAALETFMSSDIDAILAQHRVIDPAAEALALFRRTATAVPAYAAFLREHGVDADAVATTADFDRVPFMTKQGYVQKYPLPALCRDGDLRALDTIAVSSGSTGEPTFWPRAIGDELAIAARFEQVFADSFEARDKATLAVVCFPLGTWVGGMFTAACCRHLATKGYPIFTATPGNAKPEILRVVKELGPSFAQTVLLGYPPFLKDVIDSGIAAGIAWGELSPKLVLAGEVFSEDWRTLVAARAGMTRPLLDFASLYGTADAGVLGNETPVTIAIRRFLAGRPDDARAFFGEVRLPTLVQYDPCSRYIEADDGMLAFSGDNGIPLVRYAIGDRGGVVPWKAMLDRLAAVGFDPVAAARDAGARHVRDLPFAYVFGRSHFAISYFGANVFPEMVSVGLEQPAVAGSVTGKFVMEVIADADQNHELAIAVELAPGETASAALADAVRASILEHLLVLDPEFAAYVPKDRQPPRITLLPAGDPDYFPVGVKHRYSR